MDGAKPTGKTLPNSPARLTKRVKILAAVLLALGCAAVAAWWPKRKPERVAVPQATVAIPAPCRELSFEGVDHVVCEIDLRSYDIGLFRVSANGKPYRSLKAFDAAMAGEGRRPLLSMNAGMYHEDLSAVRASGRGWPPNQPDRAGRWIRQFLHEAEWRLQHRRRRDGCDQ